MQHTWLARTAVAAALGLLAAIAAPRPAAAQADPPAIAILKQAMANEADAAALDRSLAELDALVARQPKDANAHYARGWVLSKQQRRAGAGAGTAPAAPAGAVDPAVAAYDKAFELDKTLAAAPYNAGVALARAGKPKDALVRFDRALAADPKHVDAAYNAGQVYYDTKQFAKAAERWATAAKLAPDDFDAHKKLVQAYMALGKDADATKARARVLAIKQASKDPQLQKLKSYVLDQFDVGKYHVYAYEAFDTSGNLAYVYQFQVTERDRPIGSVNLETSAVIREQGVPFVLGMDRGGKHTTFPDKTWKTQPAYRAVKAEAIKKIEASF